MLPVPNQMISITCRKLISNTRTASNASYLSIKLLKQVTNDVEKKTNFVTLRQNSTSSNWLEFNIKIPTNPIRNLKSTKAIEGNLETSLDEKEDPLFQRV